MILSGQPSKPKNPLEIKSRRDSAPIESGDLEKGRLGDRETGRSGERKAESGELAVAVLVDSLFCSVSANFLS